MIEPPENLLDFHSIKGPPWRLPLINLIWWSRSSIRGLKNHLFSRFYSNLLDFILIFYYFGYPEWLGSLSWILFSNNSCLWIYLVDFQIAGVKVHVWSGWLWKSYSFFIVFTYRSAKSHGIYTKRKTTSIEPLVIHK